MDYILCSLMGYLIGNVNAAYIISRLKGFDIRERGSGNAGASNVIITIGKKAGTVTALFDISKAVIASLLAAFFFPNIRFAKILGGSACILGHIFPVFMGFHGGKGLACLAGMVIAFDPKLFVLLLIFEAVIGFGLDYIVVVPTTGSVLFTMIYYHVTDDPVGTAILGIVALVILLKHIENFRRIRKGTEVHISFLWKKDKEISRVTHKTD